MKVKIGNMVFDSNQQPIMLILTDNDKQNIANMPKVATKYCAYPEGMDQQTISEWMDKIPKERG